MIDVKVGSKEYQLEENEATKIVGKIERMIANRLSDEDIECEVANILSAMQEAEYNRDNTRLAAVYHNDVSGNTYFSYNYILEELRKIVPTMSSKRLTKILANLGMEAKWDTNRRVYVGKSARWIKL